MMTLTVMKKLLNKLIRKLRLRKSASATTMMNLLKGRRICTSANTARSGVLIQLVSVLKILMRCRMTVHNKLRNAQGAMIVQNQVQKKHTLLQKLQKCRNAFNCLLEWQGLSAKSVPVKRRKRTIAWWRTLRNNRGKGCPLWPSRIIRWIAWHFGRRQLQAQLHSTVGKIWTWSQWLTWNMFCFCTSMF